MRRALVTMTALLAVLALPRTALAQKVSVDADPAAKFDQYKTYAWVDGTKSPNPLGEQRIHAAVEQRMAAEGFTKVTENPDVAIATHVLVEEKKELTAYGYGGYPRWGGGMATARVDTYVQGTLVLDMYDAKTKQMVWRGVGTDTASDQAQKNTKKVNSALDKMFEQYPPKPRR